MNLNERIMGRNTIIQCQPFKMPYKTNKSTLYTFLKESVKSLSGRRIMSERTTLTNLLKKFTKVASPYRELDLVTINLSVALMP